MVKRKKQTPKTKSSIEYKIIFDVNNSISWLLYRKSEVYTVEKAFIDMLNKHNISFKSI